MMAIYEGVWRKSEKEKKFKSRQLFYFFLDAEIPMTGRGTGLSHVILMLANLCCIFIPWGKT
jgi:hypothetical protein